MTTIEKIDLMLAGLEIEMACLELSIETLEKRLASIQVEKD